MDDGSPVITLQREHYELLVEIATFAMPTKDLAWEFEKAMILQYEDEDEDGRAFLDFDLDRVYKFRELLWRNNRPTDGNIPADETQAAAVWARQAAAADEEEAEVQLAIEVSAREARQREARERRGEGSSTEHHPEHAQQALEAE